MNEKVTIFCITYNHVNYIEDALNGFLSQNTSFEVKACIYDDASDDGTRDIIKEYAERYPEYFTAVLSEKNRYSTSENFYADVIELCKPYMNGKYVAWCEGDDFWTNPLKLQKQVDYMEQHPECCMCAHASTWIDCRTGISKTYKPYNTDRVISDEEVILQPNGNFSTASLCYRREIQFRDKDFPMSDVEDVVLQLYALTKGYIYYMNDEMCVYRYAHSGSWTENMLENAKNFYIHAFHMLPFIDRYNEYTKKKYHRALLRKKTEYLTLALNKRIELKCSVKMPIEYDRYVNEVERVFHISSGEALLSDQQFRMMSKKKHIVIFGCGKNSIIVEEYLDNNGIDWDGYLVSKDVRIEKKDEKVKMVWNVDRYPYNYEDTFVIVSVSQKYEDEIFVSLKSCPKVEYCTPFWFVVE